MQTPPEGPGSFPFPAADGPEPREGQGETEAKLKADTEAVLKTDADVSGASTARRSILEQFIRNRPESRGAKILTILDRIRALFVAPNSPEGRARAQGNRHATRARSLFALFDAVTGGSPVTDQLRSDLDIRPVGVRQSSEEGSDPEAVRVHDALNKRIVSFANTRSSDTPSINFSRPTNGPGTFMLQVITGNNPDRAAMARLQTLLEQRIGRRPAEEPVSGPQNDCLLRLENLTGNQAEACMTTIEEVFPARS